MQINENGKGRDSSDPTNTTLRDPSVLGPYSETNLRRVLDVGSQGEIYLYWPYGDLSNLETRPNNRQTLRVLFCTSFL